MELSQRVYHLYPYFSDDYSVLKVASRPLTSIESFALEFAPKLNEEQLLKQTAELELNPTPINSDDSNVSEVPSISVHALDVLAEIYAETKPAVAKSYLIELADRYDTMRKGYWQFRIRKLGVTGQ